MSIKKNLQSSDVDDYIASHPAEIRKNLELIRKTIRKAAPEAEEVISYSMPAFRYHGMLVWYAAFTNHYGFFPAAKAIEVFKDKLGKHVTGKGTIRFQFGEPLPVKLISDIVKFKMLENLNNKVLKEAKKKNQKKKK